MRSDDLAPLIAPNPPDGSTVRWGQGVVVSWDPLTAENVIRYRGADLANLPIVASNAELLQIQPGDVVGLNIIGAGGAATIYIVGRITNPGTPQAAEAIRSAIASNLYSTDTASAEATLSGTFTDLPTVGPVLANVPIGQSGRAIVFITANIFASKPTDASDIEGIMSYAISGGTIVNPSDGESLRMGHNNIPAGATYGRATAVSLVEGLNPGLHTFTAKYRRQSGSATKEVIFSDRNLTVIAF